MTGIGQVQHTHTGYQAIDCVAYRHAPAALSLAAAPRDIVLYRIVDYGPSRVTSADRPADHNELLLLTRGSGHPAFGCMAGERYTVAANRDLRASFVPSGADSQIEFGTSAKSVNLVFPKGFLDSLLEDRGGRASVPLLFSENTALIGLISLIELELFRPGLATDIVAEQAMRSMALILSGIDPHGFIAESERISLPPVRLKRVIEFIEANLAEPLTLDLLAHVAGLSVFHFARVFRQATGSSPYRYVSERRLQHAQRLLMSPELSVHEIARACGFPRHANFSAAFARARGMSPSAFRAYFAL
ncbi:helix-turn-helix domain-containing protein [Erythrobacter donghaensis]|jgi:AraC-like DNA-binding protein|uniref:helix-turn-helix domain-containing protein n=1 Tax=Erythrobacter donghaensis TaxID=267135 RepID=UPI000939F0D5|nr:AraC family transcriptional regulator [Erythrobacter donghaensis]